MKNTRSFLFLAAVALVAIVPESSTALSIPRRRAAVSRPAATTPVKIQAAAGAAAEGSVEGEGTATIPNEVFNLVKSIVGAGVLSLPYGVAAFGNSASAVFPAIGLIGLMGIISGYTFGLIGRVCQNTNTMSYSDAWEATLGKKLSPLIAFSCFIDCFAGNLSYSMILADTLMNLLASTGVAVTRTQSLLGVTGVVLLPLCLLKNLASLAPFSLVGIGGMLYTTLAMGFRWWTQAYAPSGKFYASQLATPIFGTKGAASALSFNALILTCMLSNAYIAHFNAPKFLKELKNNTMARFHQVIGWSFAMSIAIYGAITAFGFLSFGAASNGLILNNYSTADSLMSLARIAVTISIIASYPLIFVGCRDGLFDLFKTPQDKRTNDVQNKMTIGLLGVVTLMASRLTDLGLVASIGGATFGTALVFVYPVVMFLKQQQKRTRETIPAALIGVLGVTMGAIGTFLSFQGAGGH
mmetsp:Transcript_4676/g.8921  ORF Transcript_4676/g.8921 Transcript_4676/m.8921 type:complete len:468 (+) Transcript_4676:108-1511(+)